MNKNENSSGSVTFPKNAVNTTVRIVPLAIVLLDAKEVWYIAKPMAGILNNVISIWPEARYFTKSH